LVVALRVLAGVVLAGVLAPVLVVAGSLALIAVE